MRRLEFICEQKVSQILVYLIEEGTLSYIAPEKLKRDRDLQYGGEIDM